MTRRTPLLSAGLVVGSLLLWMAPASAQETPPPVAEWWPSVEIGGRIDDLLRLDQLLGRTAPHGYLLRTASSTLPFPAGATRLTPVLPELRMVRNSELPFSLNEGGMHAGRGASFLVRGGVRVDAGAFSASLVPSLISEANQEFQTIVYGGPVPRHPDSSPWHWGVQSADLPLRFGRKSRVRLGAGESRVAIRGAGIRVGASTEAQWWGPGIRNALVLSDNAGGFPHLFAATAHPWRTPIGEVEARWIVGRLAESGFFRLGVRNDRSLAGIAATLQPSFEPGLTVGIARVVYGPAGGPERAFDVFRDVGHPNVILRDDRTPPGFEGRDQILSLFGRWIFPASGLELYGEWGRTDLPASLRDFLTDPQRSRGYTLGLQWARELDGGALARVQTEATMLEQTARLGRRVASFYTSRAVPQGYTHRGQVIGAAIGPGASSQWIAADYLRPEWRIGALAGRIRWENDMLPLRGIHPSFHAHDVTVMAGLRGGGRIGSVDAAAEVIFARRYNYLFQNQAISFEDLQQMDLANRTLRITLGPAGPRRSAPALPAELPPPPPPGPEEQEAAAPPPARVTGLP